MAFWSNATNNPKRDYRFTVTFGDAGQLWYAKKVSRPSYTIESTEHKYLNHSFNFPGHLTWQEVSLTMVDPAGDNDAAAMVNELIRKSGYGPATDPNDTTTVGKAQMVSQTNNVIIRVLDAGGVQGVGEANFGDAADDPVVLEEWTLKNAIITSVAFNEMSYDSDGLSTVEVKMKYDWAVCKSKSVNGSFQVTNFGETASS